MDHLILFRHGEAEARAASGQDIDRALKPSGRTEAQRVALNLAAKGFVPELALVSAAQRTRETWAQALVAFPGARVEFDRDLYNADATALLQAARSGDAATVMIVGHNPGIHQLAVHLAQTAEPAARRRLSNGFPTGGAAVFKFVAGRAVACEAVVFPGDGV